MRRRKNPSRRNPSKKKRLTKKAKYALIITACVVVIVLGVSLPIGLIFGKHVTVPTPFFDDFDQAQDYYIRISWNKIRGASGYAYSYYYGDATADEVASDAIKSGYTQNTTTYVKRNKGTFSFRVKSVIVGEETKFSDWIVLEIDAWKLQQPIVSIDDALNVYWAKSTFKADEKTYDVQGYEFCAYLDGEPCFAEDYPVMASSVVVNWLEKIKTTDKWLDYTTTHVWENMTLRVKVRAVVKTWYAGTEILYPGEPYDTLLAVYDDSDYTEREVVITEEVYNRLKAAA